MVLKRNPIPTRHHVLVRLKKTTEYRTESGIYITSGSDSLNDRVNSSGVEAYIVKIGDGCFRGLTNGDKPYFKVGDLVQFKQHEGITINNVEEDEIYQYVCDSDIHVVFDGEGVSNE